MKALLFTTLLASSVLANETSQKAMFNNIRDSFVKLAIKDVAKHQTKENLKLRAIDQLVTSNLVSLDKYVEGVASELTNTKLALTLGYEVRKALSEVK